MPAARMPAPRLSPSDLIAPCGMNCGICAAYLRPRNPCPGCRAPDRDKPKTRVRCKIKTCAVRRASGATTCAGCAQLPCAPLRHLDQRYRAKYHMSMIENLQAISSFGLGRLVEQERSRWVCPGCGATLCVHHSACPACQRPWR